MNHPTDPMTPVRAFIKASKRADSGKGDIGSRDAELRCAALNATASISQLLSEHDKVVEYIKELRRFNGISLVNDFNKGLIEQQSKCAGRLAAIVEGK